MSGKKYRVEQNGNFLGHYGAHTPADAVRKAIDKYQHFYDLDMDSWFDVYQGTAYTQVFLGEN